jgi:hypothetical protein
MRWHSICFFYNLPQGRPLRWIGVVLGIRPLEEHSGQWPLPLCRGPLCGTPYVEIQILEVCTGALVNQPVIYAEHLAKAGHVRTCVHT